MEYAEKYVSGGLEVIQLWCINFMGVIFSLYIQQSGSSRSVLEAITEEECV